MTAATDEFRREAPVGCLSGWTVSRLALGALAAEDAARAERHATSCVRCGERLNAERAEVGAAALEAVPGPLAALGRKMAERRARGRWWVVWAGPLTLMAAAAVALFVTSRGPGEGPGGAGLPAPNGTRTKGAMAIEATVVRHGERAATDAPLGELGRLQDGDRLKLRVRNADGQTVRVESEEGDHWQLLYAGIIVGEGLVPVGLVAEKGSKSVLRISICPEVGDCVVRTHTLDVE